MLKTQMRRLSRKLLMLVLVLVALSAVFYTPAPTQAVVPCCSDCFYYEDLCYADCAANGGSSTCYQECQRQFRNCARWCDMDC